MEKETEKKKEEKGEKGGDIVRIKEREMRESGGSGWEVETGRA